MSDQVSVIKYFKVSSLKFITIFQVYRLKFINYNQILTVTVTSIFKFDRFLPQFKLPGQVRTFYMSVDYLCQGHRLLVRGHYCKGEARLAWS